ncbi:DgyrCDS9683 [Dimorphilus gyrociliatus]|uniref:DgyrCDS9683 n=1 Tax=Dimorphilus gyrociliatus TaxID=2664684 RepID=A0A7I8W307_9ANNE|nr:DgyrCDS9683 [Dimorphilus gyrociliatus]
MTLYQLGYKDYNDYVETLDNLTESIKANLEGRNDDDWKEFDNGIVKFMKENKIPGISLTIGRNGNIIHEQTYGFANRREKVNKSNLFRIASVSKMLTSIGILRIIQNGGQLKFHQKVFGRNGILSSYSPTESGDKRLLNITVRHLLQHSGGWDREIAGDPVFYKNVGKNMKVDEPVSAQVLISYMMGQKLQFKPGSKYCYSNFGYVILGRIIEKIKGVSYEEYIKSFLTDIGVDDMRIGKTQYCHRLIEEVEYFVNPLMGPILGKSLFSTDEEEDDGSQVLLPYGSFCLESGDSDGGWLATSKSVVKLLMSLSKGEGEGCLLNKKLTNEMMKKPRYKNNKQSTCWYGLGVDVIGFDKLSFEHTGHLDGSTSIALRNDKGYCCALLSNYWPFESDYSGLLSNLLNRIEDCSLYSIPNIFGEFKESISFYSERFMLCLNVELKNLKEFNNFCRYNLNMGPSTICCCTVKGVIYCYGFWVKDSKNELLVCSKELVVEEINRIKTANLRLIYVYFVRNIDVYLLVFGQGQPNTTHYQLESDEADLERILSTPDVRVVSLTFNKERYCVVYEKDEEERDKEGGKSTRLEKKKSYRQYVEVNKEEEYDKKFNMHSRYGRMLSFLFFSETGDKIASVWNDSGSFYFSAEREMSKYQLITDCGYLYRKDKNCIQIQIEVEHDLANKVEEDKRDKVRRPTILKPPVGLIWNSKCMVKNPESSSEIMKIVDSKLPWDYFPFNLFIFHFDNGKDCWPNSKENVTISKVRYKTNKYGVYISNICNITSKELSTVSKKMLKKLEYIRFGYQTQVCGEKFDDDFIRSLKDGSSTSVKNILHFPYKFNIGEAKLTADILTISPPFIKEYAGSYIKDKKSHSRRFQVFSKPNSNAGVDNGIQSFWRSQRLQQNSNEFRLIFTNSSDKDSWLSLCLTARGQTLRIKECDNSAKGGQGEQSQTFIYSKKTKQLMNKKSKSYVCLPNYPYSPVRFESIAQQDCSLRIQMKLNKNGNYLLHNDHNLYMGVGLYDLYEVYTRIDATQHLYAFINFHPSNSETRDLSAKTIRGLHQLYNYNFKCTDSSRSPTTKEFLIGDKIKIEAKTVHYCFIKELAEDYDQYEYA